MLLKILGTAFVSIILITSFYKSTPHKPIDYWVWAGIRPDMAKKGSILYPLQGHIQMKGNNPLFIQQGIAPHPLNHEIYLVYRITGGLPDLRFLLSVFETMAMRWRRHHVKVIGLHLDFDCPTSKLLVYGMFLKELRHLLPSYYALSITGLSDWIVFGEERGLQKIAQYTDEVVFQLYQGRSHFKEIDAYLKKLAQKNIPFKIGLLQKKNTQEYIQRMENCPSFRGAVIFLQKA